MDRIGHNSLPYTHHMAEDNGPVGTMHTQQGPVYHMRLDREQLPTEPLDLNHIATEIHLRIIVKEGADLVPDLLIQMLANLAIQLMLESTK